MSDALSGANAIARLVDEVIPFWLRNGLDREHGGIMTCLDADGTLVERAREATGRLVVIERPATVGG